MVPVDRPILVARIIAEGMRKTLGQPIIVENVAGASATIGVGRVARAAGDGYTIGVGNWASQVLNGAVFTLPYDLVKDFRPIAQIASDPQVIIARTDVATQAPATCAVCRRTRTRQRREPAAPAAHRMSWAHCFNEKQARGFVSCPTASASARRCRT